MRDRTLVCGLTAILTLGILTVQGNSQGCGGGGGSGGLPLSLGSGFQSGGLRGSGVNGSGIAVAGNPQVAMLMMQQMQQQNLMLQRQLLVMRQQMAQMQQQNQMLVAQLQATGADASRMVADRPAEANNGGALQMVSNPMMGGSRFDQRNPLAQRNPNVQNVAARGPKNRPAGVN